LHLDASVAELGPDLQDSLTASNPMPRDA